MSGETFRWWQSSVEENPDSMIISVHHYVLKDTTVTSGEWEGVRRNEAGEWTEHYHRYFAEGTPNGGPVS